jgi:outer membrane protein OmpA-like peptidoglycan-associated protein
MGGGLQQLDQVIAGLNGRTAVIMVTDGASNLGPDPVAAAKNLYNKYGDKLCIHLIDYADTKDGKQINDQIAGIKPCTVRVNGPKLQDKAELDKFVQTVFYAAAQAPRAAIDGPTTAVAGQSVTFSGAKSADPAKEPLSFAWRTCDGKTGTGETFTTSFAKDGPCEVSLTVTNRSGCTDTARQPVRVGAAEERIVLRGINFDFDKAIIKPEFMPVLDQGVDILRKNPNLRITVEGYTDSVGTVAYNQGLSERRARAVGDYFAKKGIDRGRISTIGYSEFFPKYDNKTAEGRYLNRRVEIKVTK